MRARKVVAAALACAAACARPSAVQVGPGAPPVPGAIPEGAAGAAARSPRVGTLLFLGVELPEPGTTIGGHYTGATFDVRSQSYLLTEALRAGWTRAARVRGESVLHGAGFTVRSAAAVTSDLEELDDVRFGIGGRVTELEVKTFGGGSARAEARTEVAWELIDVSHGVVVMGRTHRGQARGSRPEEAVAEALDQALSALIADSLFRRALVAPLPAGEGAGSMFAPDLGPTDSIILSIADLNPPLDSGAVERVTAGLVTLQGPDRIYGTAFLLTRDGLALASLRAARQARRLRARLASGVVRPVRLLRGNSSLDLALIRVACPGECVTVDWDASRLPDVNVSVIVLAAPESDTTQPSVTLGRLGGRWGLANGVTLRTQGEVFVGAGQPVALADNGTVVAMVSGRAGRRHALLLGEALRALRVIPP